MVRVIDGCGNQLKKEARPASPKHEGNCNTYSSGSFCRALNKLQFEDFVKEILVKEQSPLMSIFEETS